MSKIKGSGKEGVHTTIDGGIYEKTLLPFSNQKNVGLNVVFETLLEIANELCKQNNMEINFTSLLEVKRKILKRELQFINRIVIETDDSGETTISIPKERKEIADGLIKSIQDKTAEPEVLIIKREVKK
ncbi:hypothetical protein KKB43_02765 [Patescibacteria group bacterium]|nr:hypothetical protein [Patescibacteria group bacterium]